MVKVSIITVCLNSSQTIRKTFYSVLNQTYANIEYLVIDGKSSDGTIDIIKEYDELFLGRMRWISEKDRGIYDAMNKGIKLATGTLIGILNSDEYYEADAVEVMVKAMTNERYQILYGAVRTWEKGEVASISLYFHKFLRDRMINHPSCFVSKAVYDDFGYYDTKYISAADYDFMLRMSDKDVIHFYPVEHVIANYKTGGMCATKEAYMDLVKMQKAHGIISEKQYKKILIKHGICKLIEYIRGK